MDRRTFLELIGVAGASTVAGCKGAPVERIYSYLTPPTPIVPGVATYYASVCRECPAGCGIIVKTREARPIKLEGNPAHPVNRGRLCARGQAGVQGLFGRHRIREPMIRIDGKLVPASWDKALAAAAELLVGARTIGLLTGLESGSYDDLWADLGRLFPNLSHVTFEPFSRGAERAASRLVFGLDDLPVVDLSQADYVLSLGADFLDAWVSPVELSRQWAEAHGGVGRRVRLDYLGPRRNLTATAADLFQTVSPESLDAFSRALLAAVAANMPPLPAEQEAAIEAVLAAIPPLPAGLPDISTFGRRLRRARNPVVLFGGTEVLGRNATATHAAVLLVNALLGAVGRSLRYGAHPALAKVDPARRAFELVDRAGSGGRDALLVLGANPAYALPGGLAAARKLAACKGLVALSCEHNETTELARVVLPVHHPLESWGDYEARDGALGLMQPVRVPLYDSRHAGDVLIELARRAGKQPGYADFRGYVAGRWIRRLDKSSTDVQVKGGQFSEVHAAEGPELLPQRLRELAGPLAKLAAPATGTGQAALIAPMSTALYDGRGCSCDWLMEAPDALTQSAWEVPVEIARDLAAALAVKTGDRVALRAADREIVAAAVVEPELAHDTVALRMGGGRVFTKEKLDSGNVMDLLDPVLDQLSGDMAFCQARVSLTRVSGGELVTVSGGSDSADRDLCLSVEMADARAGRFPVMTRHGEVRPEQGRGRGKPLPMPADDIAAEGKRPDDNDYALARHPESRWGMVVDLDRCTGCGACVVACYAENNIPMVGRTQVEKGREMQWLRIEKHVFAKERRGSSPGAPRVRFLPVMCQHCAQAPCETVCPVFAAYHTPDGLNAQIYNRCIGTRYCANNCPYKVRRFNWFDWERETPARQQLNPDVTVRSRGVMEKCTFCIQRIREASNRARFEGRKLRDGEVQPACVATCPTGALTFGDLKLPGSRVAQLAADPRGYRLLDYQVNTRPSVVYLRRIYSDDEGEG